MENSNLLILLAVGVPLVVLGAIFTYEEYTKVPGGRGPTGMAAYSRGGALNKTKRKKHSHNKTRKA